MRYFVQTVQGSPFNEEYMALNDRFARFIGENDELVDPAPAKTMENAEIFRTKLQEAAEKMQENVVPGVKRAWEEVRNY